MTYLDPQTDPSQARPRDCTRGGGRNSSHRMVDLIVQDDFSRESTYVAGWRVIDGDGFESLARVLNIQTDSCRGEFTQLVRRKTLEAVSLGDGDYRFRVAQ